MHTSFSHFLVAAGLLGVALQAQTITVPQAAAGAELNSSTSYFVNPCLNATCSMRIQYFYGASEFLNQGITGPVTINSISWRANGGGIHAGGTVHPSVQVQLSTAVAGAILAPNPTFANNHGPDLTNVYGPASITTLATAGTSPNSPIVSINLSTPFVYDPNAGDLVVDVSNQGGVAGAGLSHDQTTLAGANGARVWDFTPNATIQNPASGNNQPGLVIEMTLGYSTGPGTAVASQYGDACYDVAGTKHEEFLNTAAFDLSNSSMSLLFNGSTGYTATPGVSPYQAPTGAATVLTLADDAETTVTLAGSMAYPGGSTPTLTICSNGFVSVASGNGTSYLAGQTAFFGFSQTCWSCWHDYNPAASGGGQVKFEEVGSLSIVTWDSVFSFGSTVPNTFQLQFDRATGNVHYVWQSVSGAATLNDVHVVGFKCGGPIQAVTSQDLSAIIPATFQTGCDTNAIDLAASARPITGTSINLNTTNVPAGASFSALLLNFAGVIPGLELSGLGMPGCYQHIALGGAVTLGLGFSSSWSQAFGIPNSPIYVGQNLFGQSAAFVPGANPLGVTSSNGLRLLVGNQ